MKNLYKMLAVGSSLAFLTLIFALFGRSSVLSGVVKAAQSLPDGIVAGAASLDTVERVTMPPVDNEALLAEDILNANPDAPPRYALPLQVQITPDTHGTWETVEDGRLLWRLRIYSPKAISLNLGFTHYYMPVGGSLILYTPDYQIVRGPFTAQDNEAHGQLWTPVLWGEETVLELVISAAQLPELQLELTSVLHAYREFGRIPVSGACNLDVVCSAADGFPQVDAWRDQIRSVAVIGTGSGTFCTGFLVNNTAQDLTPYFMTANHCGIDAGNAPSLVAYWNYQNSYCRQPGSPQSGQPGDGQLNQFNSGSIFRSAYDPSDFTLVELDDPIPPEYNVHWAGWNATPDDSTSAVAIHHPATDEKRISFEDQPTTTTSYLGTTVPGDGTHIRVTDWDLGTTEPGSSGSPLFNQNGHIVGQLHGGFAACGNDDSDWYGRVSVSWTGGGSDPSRLSNWLDPVGGGTIVVLDGRDEIEGADFDMQVDPASLDVCIPQDGQYAVILTPLNNFTDTISLSVSGVPGGVSSGFSVNNIVPPFTSTLTISNTAAASPGNYPLDVVGVSTTRTHTTTVQFNLFDVAPNAPVLLTPPDGAPNVPVEPTFTWTAVSSVSDYFLEVATDSSFNTIVYSATETTTSHTIPAANALNFNTTYYWRATAQNACGANMSTTFDFTTGDAPIEFCDTPGLPIPDVGTTSDDLVYPGSGTIEDLDVYINAPHTWVGDLTFTISNSFTSVTIIDRPGYSGTGFGCSGDNVDATLDDEGGDGPVENQCANNPALFGTPTPNNPLSAFDGQDINGTWTLTIQDSAAGDIGTLNEWCLVPTITVPYGVTLSPDSAETGLPGTTVTHTLSITNTGSTTDTFDLAVSGQTWTTVLSNNNVTLAAGEGISVEVTVEIPANALGNENDTATLTATSQGDPGQSDTAELTTTAQVVYAVNLSGDSSVSGQPGETVTHTVQITNTGNTTDTFDLAVNGTWTTTLEFLTVTLAVGESASVEVTVEIPANASGNENDVATLTATSQGDPGQSDTAELTTLAITEPTTYFLYLPAIHREN